MVPPTCKTFQRRRRRQGFLSLTGVQSSIPASWEARCGIGLLTSLCGWGMEGLQRDRLPCWIPKLFQLPPSFSWSTALSSPADCSEPSRYPFPWKVLRGVNHFFTYHPHHNLCTVDETVLQRRWRDTQGQVAGRRPLRWAWHKVLDVDLPSNEKGTSGRLNLADLCLQMAITNKDRNLTWKSEIEKKCKTFPWHCHGEGAERDIGDQGGSAIFCSSCLDVERESPEPPDCWLNQNSKGQMDSL